MAHVRAEILAASRSRTGWQSFPVPQEKKPMVDSLRMSFEEKTDNKDCHTNGGIMTSSYTSEGKQGGRRMGAKVSAIANIFQSLSPPPGSTGPSLAKPRINCSNNGSINPGISVAATVLTCQKDNDNHVQKSILETKKQANQDSNKKSHKFSTNKKEPPSTNGTISAKINIGANLPTTITGSPVKINRTESRVSRFNNARAVFEKFQKDKLMDPSLDFEESQKIISLSKPQPSAKIIPNCNLNREDNDNFDAYLRNSSSHEELNDYQTKTNKNIQDDSRNSTSTKHVEKSIGKYVETENVKNELMDAANNSTNNSTKCPPVPSRSSKPKTNESQRTKTRKPGQIVSKEPVKEFKPQEERKNSAISVQSELIDKIVSEIAEESNPTVGSQAVDLLEEIPDLNSCDISGIPDILDFDECFQGVEMMTEEEAQKLLSRTSWSELVNDEESHIQVNDVTSTQDSKSVSDYTPKFSTQKDITSPSKSYVNGTHHSDEFDEVNGSEISNEGENSITSERSVVYEDTEYHIFPDGHYYTEKPGLISNSDEEDDDLALFLYSVPPRKKTRVKFSSGPMKIFSTHSVEDYDRKNEDVDPVAASAEYELEKRIEKMEVFSVSLEKGSDGLGLSIIGMGVGADAGLERLGIFVKTITENGAAYDDGRIQVNDQIIEVDGKSLVGVTQVYAASVLRGTSGKVEFLIGREKDSANSEIAQLISQSLQNERISTHDNAPEKDLPLSPEPESDPACLQEGYGFPPKTESRDSMSSTIENQTEILNGGELIDLCNITNEPLESNSYFNTDDLTPIDCFTETKNSFEAIDEKINDLETLKFQLAQWEQKYSSLSEELILVKENSELKSQNAQQEIEDCQMQLRESESALLSHRKDIEHYQHLLEEAKTQYINLERKYHKAKKLIKGFQQREHGFTKKEDDHFQELHDKEKEYTALVKALKDKIIMLERRLIEVQKSAGMTVPATTESCLHEILSEFLEKTKSDEPNEKRLSFILQQLLLSDSSSSHDDISPEFELSDNAESAYDLKDRIFLDDDTDLPFEQTQLLDTTAAKQKAELSSRGSIANRQPPSKRLSGYREEAD